MIPIVLRLYFNYLKIYDKKIHIKSYLGLCSQNYNFKAESTSEILTTLPNSGHLILARSSKTYQVQGWSAAEHLKIIVGLRTPDISLY